MWRLHHVLLLLLLSFCLAQTDPLRSQIIGGHEAIPHSRPYMAYLRGLKNACGGFLVAPQWVMTAAHCDEDYVVTLGEHNIHQIEGTEQVFHIEASIPHPEYSKKTYSNDIRLLKLDRMATLNTNVNILNLPSSIKDLNGTSCSVAGWGRVSKDLRTGRLHETDVTISPCKFDGDNSREICAGSPDKPNTAFRGDSGGPLVCNGVAEGIVSHGGSRPPAAYTRIAYYLDWINRTMEMWAEE